MVAPVFQREGSRLGGVTKNAISAVARTDSAGARLFLDVYKDPGMTTLAASSTAGVLNAANNYTQTVSVSGLAEGRRYYYRMRADDGGGNSTLGDYNGYTAGTFKTARETRNSLRIVVGACDPMSPGANYDPIRSTRMWSALDQLHADQFAIIGDIYYSDVGTNNGLPNYSAGAWRVPTSDADATIEAYRTNIISCFSEPGRSMGDNPKARFYSNTPTAWMWDDHDRGWNDMNGQSTWGPTQVTRAANAQKAGHELFMDLNSKYISDQGRSWVHGITQEDYYYFDVHPARVIVLDCRTFRDPMNAADVPGKSMIGAVQLAWLKSAISSNPNPCTIILSPLMLDGFHGWNESTTDGWVNYSYEREEILEYIRLNGNPARTVFCGGDTHGGAVAQYKSTNGDIWEFTAGNLWPTSFHGYINGWGASATGTGGTPILLRVNEPNVCVIDIDPTGMTVGLLELLSGSLLFDRRF